MKWWWLIFISTCIFKLKRHFISNSHPLSCNAFVLLKVTIECLFFHIFVYCNNVLCNVLLNLCCIIYHDRLNHLFNGNIRFDAKGGASFYYYKIIGMRNRPPDGILFIFVINVGLTHFRFTPQFLTIILLWRILLFMTSFLA